MKPFKHTITVKNKKHQYTIKPIDKESVYFDCKAAGISQRFHIEDIPTLLIDLPAIIISEAKWLKKQEEIIRFRVSAEDKRMIEEKAVKAGFSTISAFLRTLAHNA